MTGAVGAPAGVLSLHLRQGAGLEGRPPLRLGRRRALAVPAIPARLRLADRRAPGAHADQRRQLGHCLVGHLVSPPVSGALSVASCSNSAESFPWTSITLRALSSSLDRR